MKFSMLLHSFCIVLGVVARCAPGTAAFSVPMPLAGCARGHPRECQLAARPRSSSCSRRRGRFVARMQEGDGEEINEREMTGLSDLSLLGAFGKLRAGLPTKTRELPKPSRINESFEIQCEKASYLLKINRHRPASIGFEGEAASQQALRFGGMMCPKALRVGDLPDGGSYMIQEFLDFDADALHEPDTQRALGILLAQMHLHHAERHQQFGFGLNTCLGTLPMDNSFCDTWSEFFVEQRLRPHFSLVVERFPEEARELILLAPLIFDKARFLLENDLIRPSILHGNLSPQRTAVVKWQRNDQELTRIYLTGPSSFYGDSEFDMAFEDWPLPETRTDFSPFFYRAYYSTIERRPGHAKRRQMYQLFHLLNGALMNGGTYLDSAVAMAFRFLA